MSRFDTGDWQRKGQSDQTVGLPSFLSRPALRRGLVILLAGIFCTLGFGVPVKAADEFRGLWVIRHTLTSPEQIRQTVDRARRANFNALLVQVRGRGDAYYQSRLVPGGEDLPKDDPAFDPLALVVREAHAAGLEVHAWVNVFLAWYSTERRPRSAEHVFLRHPEWFMASADGIDLGRLEMDGVNLVERGVEGRYLSPGIPEVRAHLLQVVEEIVSGYEIDGVHLDYIRYPNVHYDYNLISRAEFVRQHRFDPLDLVRDVDEGRKASGRSKRMEKLWQRWRTDQVSLQVVEIRQLLMRLKPWVKLSAAVKPDFEQAYYQYGQDWIGWINRQTIDFVVPMLYGGSTEEFGRRIKEARKYVKRGHLYAGIGVWNQPSSETVAQVELARRLGLKGVALFSYDSLIEKPEKLHRLRKQSFRLPSRVPHMGWKQERHDGKAETR